jgi:hypothetical protein
MDEDDGVVAAVRAENAELALLHAELAVVREHLARSEQRDRELHATLCRARIRVDSVGCRVASPSSQRPERPVVHLDEAREAEWLAGLGARLKRDRKVPWEKRELLKLVGYRFDDNWGASSEEIRPPGLSPEEVVESLVELGVLRARADGSYDVPDLYLAGLGLVRRGGVASSLSEKRTNPEPEPEPEPVFPVRSRNSGRKTGTRHGLGLGLGLEEIFLRQAPRTPE